jgi:hypothetical protein
MVQGLPVRSSSLLFAFVWSEMSADWVASGGCQDATVRVFSATTFGLIKERK